MGACSQCKVSPGRDWTYTIFQALRTSESTAESIQSTMKSDDDRAIPTARTAGATTAGMTVSVDSSHVLFEVSDRGEAGLMEDLGCAVEDTCPFGKAWFKQRLTQLTQEPQHHLRDDMRVRPPARKHPPIIININDNDTTHHPNHPDIFSFLLLLVPSLSWQMSSCSFCSLSRACLGK